MLLWLNVRMPRSLFTQCIIIIAKNERNLCLMISFNFFSDAKVLKL